MGSELGLVLFRIFINGLGGIAGKCKVAMCADDIELFCFSSLLSKKLNLDLLNRVA